MAIVPLLAALYFWSQRRADTLLSKVVAPRLRTQLVGAVSKGRRTFKSALILAVFALIALVLAPAVLRVPMADVDRHAVVDVSGRVGLALMLGRIEVRADSPPLSYVSTERWHARPLSVSLALMLR